jgi:Ferritin-like
LPPPSEIGGSQAREEHSIEINSREDLAFILSEASTLEHMIMCEYLFAAFSLKKGGSEGLSQSQADMVARWERVVTTVAVQEMTHLALVNNMLVAIGSSPYFQHGNFPQPSRYFSPNIRLALMPFGDQAIRHFLYLERPEGMSVEGVPGFDVAGDLNPSDLSGGVVPKGQYFSTVGNLYRGLEKGFYDLSEKYGEDAVFLGEGLPQATEDIFGLPGLLEVNDLKSATRAVEGIVEMGEGARGNWENAHFGMFLRIYKEYMDAKKKEPGFRPARPVVAAYSSLPTGVDDVPLISDPFTSKVSDLFNACYGLTIQVLCRFYVHDKSYPEELQTLADTAVGMMTTVVAPLGRTLTSLPVGGRLPGLNAGPTFELQQREYVLPHRRQAFMVLQERIGELASYSSGLAGESHRGSEDISLVSKALSGVAKGFKLEPDSN